MRREGRARGAGKGSGARRRHTSSKGHDLARKTERKMRTKKLNTDISVAAQRGAGPKRSGRQALAERAASEAKFVLIAERKTQEEA